MDTDTYFCRRLGGMNMKVFMLSIGTKPGWKRDNLLITECVSRSTPKLGRFTFVKAEKFPINKRQLNILKKMGVPTQG